jgi:hypothetical protein
MGAVPEVPTPWQTLGVLLTIRRFEVYKIWLDTPPQTLDRFERAFSVISKYIPQVHESFLGKNLLDTEPTHVWEHTFESWNDLLEIYMLHPYHACVLDRYLGPESPECISEVTTKGALVYYETEGWKPLLNRGLKRLVLLRVSSQAEQQFTKALVEEAQRLQAQVRGMTVSSLARDLSGTIWGWVSWWTHVWEQVFSDEGALKTYLGLDSWVAEQERDNWQVRPDSPVEDVSTTLYWKGH